MIELTDREKEILIIIKNADRLPIVRLELKNSQDNDIISTALNNVWITAADDSMEKVKADGEILQHLKDEGLIYIDYSLVAAKNEDYEIYYVSSLFKQLCDLVEEGKNRPRFLFDTAGIKKGMVRLTPKGEKLINF